MFTIPSYRYDNLTKVIIRELNAYLPGDLPVSTLRTPAGEEPLSDREVLISTLDTTPIAGGLREVRFMLTVTAFDKDHGKAYDRVWEGVELLESAVAELIKSKNSITFVRVDSSFTEVEVEEEIVAADAEWTIIQRPSETIMVPVA